LICVEKIKRKPLFRHPGIVITPCDFGHGIFTTTSIPADTTLEECPYLRISANECGDSLDDYVFNLETAEENGELEIYSLVLGWGSLFNHSYDHNTEYWHDTDRGPDCVSYHQKGVCRQTVVRKLRKRMVGLKGIDP
jgi:hypothetical protein